MKNKTITIKVRCGENGKTFGAVTNKEVSDELAKMGLEVDKRKIIMEQIKQVGTYKVTAKLHSEVSVNFTVIVEKL